MVGARAHGLDVGIARVDLHCHTRASFDSSANPAALMIRASERAITHIAITDHDTIDGALEAVAAAPPGLHVIVGCETNTLEGDLIFLFVERALPAGRSARETIAAGREQGALVGIPHPFDQARRSALLDPSNALLVALVDWVEGWNARVGMRESNDQAVAMARRHGAPAIAVSDAHTLLEIGSAFTTMTGDPSTAAGLKAALRGRLTITGPATQGRKPKPRT